MTFGPNHYVPVLKAKAAEKRALKLVDPAIRSQITPLMEIIERDHGHTLGEHLGKTFNGLAESLHPYEKCFLDVRELAADGPDAAEEVFSRASAMRIAFTPVTGISRTVDTVPALKYAAGGVAVRLTRDEFEQGGLAQRLADFMRQHALRVPTTDLIMDLGSVDGMITEGVAELAAGFLAEVPDPHGWRTLTLSATAIPLSMGVIERRSHGLVERVEWLAWRDHIASQGAGSPRIPTYSDCGVQHPAGVEGVDFRVIPLPAVIRYTLPEHWLLIKGVSNCQAPMPAQFQQLATQLAYGHLSPHFEGDTHCAGCAAVRNAANGRPKLGSLGVWRRIGTVHHITMVVQQLNSLPSA